MNNVLKLEEAKELVEYYKKCGYKIVITSGGFDPIHRGHVRCIQEAAKLGMLCVIVNGDGFLTRKKGKPFMCHEERMEIVAALSGVGFVVGWDDGSQTVCGALQYLEPDIFAKGGDRSVSTAVPEFDVCNQIGCEVVFGVGGIDKIQSSSALIRNVEPAIRFF